MNALKRSGVQALTLTVVVIVTATSIVAAAQESTEVSPREDLGTISASDSLLAQARSVLVRWLELLSADRFAEAVELYGGDYGVLEYWNPPLAPQDYEGLLHNGCKINGLQCLPVKEIVQVAASGDSGFAFTVKLGNDDGSTLVIGPCCGASAEDEPPDSLFVFWVRPHEGGRFVVESLPPYTP
jgi:hypothetical protein